MWSRRLVAEGRPALAFVRPLRAPPDVPENGTAHNIVATPARAWATARNVNVTGRLSDGAAFMDQLSHVSASVVDGELMLFATLVGPALPVDGARLTAPVQRKFCTLPDGPNEPTHGCRRAAERGGSRLDRRPRAATHRRSTRPWRWDRSCRCRSQAPTLSLLRPRDDRSSRSVGAVVGPNVVCRRLRAAWPGSEPGCESAPDTPAYTAGTPQNAQTRSKHHALEAP